MDISGFINTNENSPNRQKQANFFAENAASFT